MIGPMRASIGGTTCCGMKELYGLSAARWDHKTQQNVYISVEELVATVYHFRRNQTPFCFVLFSDLAESTLKQGIGLAEYIREHKLGDILKTKPTRNPNSRNLIHAWIWTLDTKALNAWYKKESRRDETESEA